MSGSDINDKSEPQYPNHPDDKSNMTLEELLSEKQESIDVCGCLCAQYHERTLTALRTAMSQIKIELCNRGLEETYEEIKEIVRKELV